MSRASLGHAGSVLWQLTLRELRVRYKQSVLGIAWALLVPLALIITLSLVFSRWTQIADSTDTGIPYALFVAIGIVPWLFFAQSLTQAVNALVANRSLVTKIYFSREVFPFSAVLCAFFDALLALPLVVCVAWWYGPHEQSASAGGSSALLFLQLPIVFAIQLMLTTGLAMVLSCGNLFYRDVKHALPIVLQIWMLASNVMYPLPVTSIWGQVWSCINPLIPILSAYRSIVWLGRIDNEFSLALAGLISCAVLAGGWALFRRAEPQFAEAI